MKRQDIVSQFRHPDHEVDPVFVHRWSPRAMSGETVSGGELMALFEAARWAPSCFNDQPWHFLYARRETAHWARFFDLLVEANQVWAKDAAALMVVVSRKNFEYNGQFSRTHSFDTGAAWQNLALQGSRMGLVVHGMAGFDYDRAAKELKVPDDYMVEAMAAVGRPGDKAKLPQALQEKEQPSGRKPVDEFVFEGGFNE